MAKTRFNYLRIPIQDALASSQGLVATTWSDFFKAVVRALDPIGYELTFLLVNNQASAANVTDMAFSGLGTSAAYIDYLIQRITVSTGAVESIEAGVLILIYKPAAATWVIVSGAPSTAGVTLTITADGQVQYTSTNITGTPVVSRIAWRARLIAAKHYAYSKAGA